MRLKNPRKKGNHNRNLCRTELEKEGWLVGIVERTGRFVSPHDLYNLFDLVCVKNNKTLYVQVSSGKPKPPLLFQNFANLYAGDNLLVEQWTKKNRKNFEITRYPK